MEKIKRQASSRLLQNNNGKRISYFEDLSNELIYEIFEYIDYLHIYKIFSNLNLRFHNLVNNSKFLIKIKLTSISKKTFDSYHKTLIEPNTHRINSFSCSNLLIYDSIFSTICKLFELNRLETLMLYNIEGNYLKKLVNQLSTLSRLSSLVITSVDQIENKNDIYQQIFRLPVLKYCRLSLKEWSHNKPLQFSNNQSSSIEYLVITNEIYLNEIDSLLSYLPQLRRLSFNSLGIYWNEREKILSNPLNSLTHLSLQLYSIKFHQFAQLIQDLFPNIQVLHLTIHCYHIDQRYLDADKWQQLILSHLPYLRIFDIQMNISEINNDNQLNIETQIEQFETSFWIERQWFFEYYFYQSKYGNSAIFYSINPYRKKSYTLYERLNKSDDLYSYQTNLNTVEYVYIQSKTSHIINRYYFPNATKLTIEDEFSPIQISTDLTLSRILSLNKLTKLVIESHQFPFKTILKLLYYATNIQTLEFESMSLYDHNNLSIQQSELFRLVSTRNNIKNVIYTGKCKLEHVKVIVSLCPQIQHLSIHTWIKDFIPIIQYLFDKRNGNNQHFFSLCFIRVSYDWLTKLEQWIISRNLFDDCIIKLIETKLYLWW